MHTEKRLAKTWEAAAFDREKNEWVHTELHSYDQSTPVTEDLFTRQAKPTIVRPSKRVKPTRDCETTVFLGDTQFPFQDRRALELARIAVAELQPDTIVFLGDDLDCPSFSRFEQRKEWNDTLQQGLDEFHEYIASLQAESGAKVVVHEGNHNQRLERMIRAYNGDLVGLKRARAQHELGVLTIGFLMRFDEMGVEYVTGYPNAEYWHEDHLKSFHGKLSVSDGSTMARIIGKSTVSCVQGHTHRAELVYRTARVGRQDHVIFGMNPGTLCDLSQTPSGEYATDERGRITTQHPNWQQSVGVVFHNPDMAQPHLFMIQDGVIQIFDRRYSS